jgi:hypothetical protein
MVVAAVVLTGCAGEATRVSAPATPVAVPVDGVAAEPIRTGHASDRAPNPNGLRLVSKPDDAGGSSCEVVERDTNRVLYSASSKDTAAGGSQVECLDFLAGGKVIRFHNSRGVYAKDARPGSDQDIALPCGAGAFADDVTSCVQTDTSPFAYSSVADAPAPFDIAICDIAKYVAAFRANKLHPKLCTTLVTVPRGLNRYAADASGPVPPSWDARYCSSDRVVVVANGELHLFEAPSGAPLSKVPAPGQTRITSCAGDAVETTDTKGSSSRRFYVDGGTLRAR